MDQKIMDHLNQWFAEYTAQFITGVEEDDRNIVLKRQHTRRVCRETLFLSEHLGLDGKQITVAEISALLHDIGRFEQYRRFKTFADEQSVDHAKLGCEIIDKERCLAKLSPDDQDLIKRVILYHNRAFLPESETSDCLFFSHLLRDADKLDIWHVVTSYYSEIGKTRNTTLELGLPDTPGISDKVYDSLMNRQMVLKAHLQNLNDFKLLQMGWAFDLNFTPSLRRLADKGYLDMIKKTLPQNNRIDEVFETITRYMHEK
jgi:putative nucleotidyltransferase with HDIG domain